VKTDDQQVAHSISIAAASSHFQEHSESWRKCMRRYVCTVPYALLALYSGLAM